MSILKVHHFLCALWHSQFRMRFWGAFCQWHDSITNTIQFYTSNSKLSTLKPFALHPAPFMLNPKPAQAAPPTSRIRLASIPRPWGPDRGWVGGLGLGAVGGVWSLGPLRASRVQGMWLCKVWRRFQRCWRGAWRFGG